jgi:hypothetical protein
MNMAKQRKQSRKTKKNKGGSFTLAALGQAASEVLVPASFFYGLKQKQYKSLKKMYRGRDR